MDITLKREHQVRRMTQEVNKPQTNKRKQNPENKKELSFILVTVIDTCDKKVPYLLLIQKNRRFEDIFFESSGPIKLLFYIIVIIFDKPFTHVSEHGDCTMLIKVTHSGTPSLNNTVEIELLFGVNSTWSNKDLCNTTSEAIDCMQVLYSAANTTSGLKNVSLKGSKINCTFVMTNKTSTHYQGKCFTAGFCEILQNIVKFRVFLQEHCSPRKNYFFPFPTFFIITVDGRESGHNAKTFSGETDQPDVANEHGSGDNDDVGGKRFSGSAVQNTNAAAEGTYHSIHQGNNGTQEQGGGSGGDGRVEDRRQVQTEHRDEEADGHHDEDEADDHNSNENDHGNHGDEDGDEEDEHGHSDEEDDTGHGDNETEVNDGIDHGHDEVEHGNEADHCEDCHHENHEEEKEV